MHEPSDHATGRPDDAGSTQAHQAHLDCPLAEDPETGRPDGVPVDGVSAPGGSITTVAGTLVLAGDVGTDLCLAFRAADRRLDGVDCIDARKVAFLGSPGLSLLAEVARVRGTGVPLWASRAALRPLRLSGLDRLFDVRPVG